jgi:predicted ATPase/DNA-binding CsgD family transcriptional regulator
MTLLQAKRRRGQLPAEVTGFVGREDELLQLAQLLRDRRAGDTADPAGGSHPADGTAHPAAAGDDRPGQDPPRLITVTGLGGVGKTRLAVRAAARAARRYPDGVHFADLATVADPESLLASLAAALGLGDDAGLDAIVAHLRDRRLLLVLDTCEHLIDACARLTASVLRNAAGVTVLATSRQPLDVPGEHIVPLGPLPVPDHGVQVPAGSAVELLAQRAASVIPGFTVTDELIPDVIALCQRLDGVPLAIELAALRLRALPLAEMSRMARQVDSQSRLLTGVRRTAVPRHRSLLRSVEWSRDLCTDAERAAWGRLSVFAGSFDLATAEAVCSDASLPPAQVTQAVIGLTDKSVLLREALPAQAADGGPASDAASRYRLPGALRDCGAQLLAETADAGAAVRARYLEHWMQAAERFAREFLDDQLSQYQLMRREQPNLYGALDHALTLPVADQSAARLGCALFMYWVLSGTITEGRQWLDRVVGHYRPPSPARARALAARAFLAAMAGDLQAGRADAEASITIAAETGDIVARARGYVALHRVASWTGDLAAATVAERLAVPALEQAGDQLGLAQVDIQSGLAHLATDPRACAGICERGLRRLPAGELWATSYLLGLSVLAQFSTGEYEAAAERARKTLAMKHELGDAVGVAYGLAVLAFLASAVGRHERAAVLLGATGPLWEKTGYRYTGNPWVEEQHRKTVRAALDTLGEARYSRLRDAGAAQPLHEIIAVALGTTASPVTPVLAPVRGSAPGPAGASASARAVAASPPRARAASTTAASPATGPLTSREVEIATLVANGQSNREIAEHMVISKRTVDAHVDHIFAKLGISSRVQLTLWLRDRIPRARPSQDQTHRVT